MGIPSKAIALHGSKHRGGAGHVGLHGLHALGRLQREASGIEDDAFPDDGQKGLRSIRLVIEANQSGWKVTAGRNAEQASQSLGGDLLLVENGHLDSRLATDLGGQVGHGLGRLAGGRFVHQIAGQENCIDHNLSPDRSFDGSRCPGVHIPQTFGLGRFWFGPVLVESILGEEETFRHRPRRPIEIDLMKRGRYIDNPGGAAAQRPGRLSQFLQVEIPAHSDQKEGLERQPATGWYRRDFSELPAEVFLVQVPVQPLAQLSGNPIGSRTPHQIFEDGYGQGLAGFLS